MGVLSEMLFTRCSFCHDTSTISLIQKKQLIIFRLHFKAGCEISLLWHNETISGFLSS